MKIACIILSLATLCLIGCQREMLNLQTLKDWNIVVSPEVPPSELYAAKDFQYLLNQATGFNLEIMTYPKSSTNNIFIGHSAAMEKNAAGFPIDEFGEEELQIKILPDNIVIAGGLPRGTLYGVYEFFERYLGLRFLTKDHTYKYRTHNSQFLVLSPQQFHWGRKKYCILSSNS